MKHRILLLLLAFMLCTTALAEDPMALYDGHILLESRDAGPCKRLTGSVQVVVVLVNVQSNPWSEAETAAIRQELLTAARMLRSEAAFYGADVQLSFKFHTVTVSTPPDMNASTVWVDRILRQLPDVPARTVPGAWANTPLLLFCSSQGRAFAHCESAIDRAEYAVLFRGDDSGAIRHELLHLFGAEDYYVEATVAEAAEATFPNSLMLSSDRYATVDDVTAYVIGWTDSPGDKGMQLLAATCDVSAVSLLQSRIANQVTGLGAYTAADYSYTGMMVDGVPEGWGSLTWDGGDVYIGALHQGQPDGTGVYTWADGTVYAGDFSDGVRTGHGASCWSNGTIYTGGYQAGQRHGYGVYIWPNGDVYTGDFVDGKRTGHGTLVKADGTVYTGEFVGGSYCGTGTLIFPDGSSYTGTFMSDCFHGSGTYRWPTGASFTGEFKLGQRHGHGIYRRTDGSILEGEWANDAYCVP